MSDPDRTLHLKVGDVADILGMSRHGVLRAMERGDIKFTTLPRSRHRRVAREWLDDCMKKIGLSPEDAAYGGLGLTVGQAARLLRVGTETVNNAIDEGRIQGACRIPGSRHRRIPGAALVRYMIASNCPKDTREYVERVLRAAKLLAPE